jgi:hypothetical protein
MANSDSFDLPAFMLSHFSRVDFGGDLFNQWPVGIRFEIGTENVSRAAKLYEFAFAKADDCIVVSQDWTVGEEIVSRSTTLFATSGNVCSTTNSRKRRIRKGSARENLLKLRSDLAWRLRPHK